MESEEIFLPPFEEAAAVKVEVQVFQDTPEQESSQNPWPHLEDYFLFKSRDKKNSNLLCFWCLLCQHKETIIKGHASSLYNLKSHVNRIHPAFTVQFEERIKAGSSRRKHKQSPGSSTSGQSSQPPTKKIHLPNIGDTLGTDVSQSVVDTKIMDLFIYNMLPLHVVESPTFVSLIKTLNPSKMSMSHHTLSRRILVSHKQLEEHIIRLLRDVPWVATTVDCWSVHNRSYMGMTAHWLCPKKTRTRQYAILACSRLKGHHTFDVLTEAMMDTHYKFHLQDKVTRTTTDNGNNFVKTFVQFGTEAKLLPDIPRPATNPGMEDPDVDPEGEDDDEVEYISVEAILGESNGLGHNLSVHMRCAAHTFNLVASVDADYALGSEPFKTAYRKAMSKAQAFWNQQSRSTVSHDCIVDELERRLVIPTSTRWNSTYDSVVDLNNLLQNKRGAVHRVMIQMKLQTFTDSDVRFLKEYAQVMSIVAKALDKIQGVDQAYLGSLLPTVAATSMKLKEAKSKGLLYCSPIVDSMLSGISKRFGPLLEDQQCLLAAAFHPRFRLFWLEKYNHSQVSSVKRDMEIVVERSLREISEEESSTSSNEDENEEDDFFSSITQPQESSSHRSLKSKALNLVKTWLEAGSKEVLSDNAFMGEQVFIDLFIKYNTAIPSSAVIERLFSKDKDILRAKRATLSDANFERLMFMKGNQHHIETMEKDAKLEQDHLPSLDHNNHDDDDDIPQLSASTMAALQEFYAEQLQEKDDESQKFQENWQLSQFWYDDRTAEYLAKEAFAASGGNGKICCLSSPTAFRKMMSLKPEGCILKLLEFDRRFESFGEDFLFYDYNDPLNFPPEWEHYFDVVLADPPFLSEECLTKTSKSIKYLTKNKIILCVGAIMEECAEKLLGVKPTNFEIKHENNLQNRLMCYTNYKPHVLSSSNPDTEHAES